MTLGQDIMQETAVYFQYLLGLNFGWQLPAQAVVRPVGSERRKSTLTALNGVQQQPGDGTVDRFAETGGILNRHQALEKAADPGQCVEVTSGGDTFKKICAERE